MLPLSHVDESRAALARGLSELYAEAPDLTKREMTRDDDSAA